MVGSQLDYGRGGVDVECVCTHAMQLCATLCVSHQAAGLGGDVRLQCAKIRIRFVFDSYLNTTPESQGSLTTHWAIEQLLLSQCIDLNAQCTQYA